MPWVAGALGALAGGAGGTAAGTGAAAAGTAAGMGAGIGSALGGATGATLGSLGGTAAGTGAGIGSALAGATAPTLGSSLGAAGGATGGGLSGALSSLGDSLGVLFSSQSPEAAHIASLGQSVPEGVSFAGPGESLTAGSNLSEASLMFPQVQSTGASAVPESFATPQLPATSGGGMDWLGQLLGSRGSGGGNSGSAQQGQSKVWNIADALGPQMLQTLMNPSAGLSKPAPTPPQLSLPQPAIPQVRPDDRTAFLAAFRYQ